MSDISRERGAMPDELSLPKWAQRRLASYRQQRDELRAHYDRNLLDDLGESRAHDIEWLRARCLKQSGDIERLEARLSEQFANQHGMADWVEMSRTYKQERDEAVALLKVASCPDPNCDGEGASAQQVTEQEPRCCGHFLGSGECCGEAIAAPVAALEQVQCQWCYERDALLRRVGGESNE